VLRFQVRDGVAIDVDADVNVDIVSIYQKIRRRDGIDGDYECKDKLVIASYTSFSAERDYDSMSEIP